MKCPNCGADVENEAKFCRNCGKHIIKNSNNGFNFQKIVNLLLENPKLILAVIAVIIVVVGVSSILSSGGDTTGGNGVYDTEVYGINFHIPEGYIESDRGQYTNGEYADFKKGGAIIEISVSTDSYFKESKYIDSKFSKTVNGKSGTVYVYKAPSNGMAYVYYDQGKRIVIRDATFTELEQIVI